MGILSGYRVVDLSIAMAGPPAAMRLGRFEGYLKFQARASAVLRDGLISGEDHEVLLSQVNALFTRSSTGIFPRNGA